ncbi:protein rep [Agriterribacter humi]|uniref:protein rep n=1 Tax=Agriterribacter humi TaxID=1104781 RepID=UPI001264A278|nr:protein rep [Agriterribacter humi]
MKRKPHSNAFSGSSLDTLAQTETSFASGDAIIVNGKGSDVSNIKSLKGKAKRKLVTQKMIFSLLDVAKKNGSKDRVKGYYNTFHCQNKIDTANGRSYGKYCKNRFCTLCAAIRKAQIINKYLPELQKWKAPYFVTITAKSVHAKSLKKRMQDMNRGLRILTSKYRKRAIRGTNIKLIGIKSLECNFNPRDKTYNPHLHIIVKTKDMADILVKEWLQLCTPKFARSFGQKIIKIKDLEKQLIETIKYGSKVFTEPDVRKKGKKKEGSADIRNIYVVALDNIFEAMKGLRIFDRFGFNLPPNLLKNEAHSTLVTDFKEWVYDIKTFDWRNTKTGEFLTKFHPMFNLLVLLELGIDVEKE